MILIEVALIALFSLTGGDGDTLQGKVYIEEGKPAVLHSGEKEIRLTSRDKEIAAAFKDTRISGREIKVFGGLRNDGAFDVREFYVARAEGLLRLIYFCDT